MTTGKYCDHKNLADMERMATFQREVPHGYKPFQMEILYCRNCRLPVAARFIVPHPSAPRLGATNPKMIQDILDGKRKLPPDTVIEATCSEETRP